MAGPGGIPNTDGQRRRRNAPTFDWVWLPAAGRQGQPPELPPIREWTEHTIAWWASLWASPQAVMWDQTGRTLYRLAVLHHHLIIDAALDPGKSRAASLSAEMRQIEDRHGLSAKALLHLRWRVSDEPGPTAGVVSIVPAPAGPGRPAQRAARAVWIDWSVEHGCPRDRAEAMTKRELIDRYGAAVATPTPKKPTSPAVERMRRAMNRRK